MLRMHLCTLCISFKSPDLERNLNKTLNSHILCRFFYVRKYFQNNQMWEMHLIISKQSFKTSFLVGLFFKLYILLAALFLLVSLSLYI